MDNLILNIKLNFSQVAPMFLPNPKGDSERKSKVKKEKVGEEVRFLVFFKIIYPRTMCQLFKIQKRQQPSPDKDKNV